MKNHPVISPDFTIKECMVIIDKFAKRISFVVDKGILVGVVTDGDIRRGLLKNIKLEDSVTSVMNKQFVSFPVDTDSKIIRERFSKRIRHIPLLNNRGSLVDVADPLGNFRISVLEPSLNGNELIYVTECIETNWISSQGKFVTQFEQAFEDFHPGAHALAVSNGTVALHLALIALGVGPGDEVIVPNLTFAASANAVIHAGANPVFCEINPNTWCLEPNEAKELIGPKTKAIMPVHLYGQPCDMKALRDICDEYDLLMIEDSAEALGSEWNGQRVGTFGDAATFSFFGNKTISTGEGGMVLFKDSKVSEKASILRDHGMSKRRRYWHENIGYNYRLTNLQAAIGVAQMESVQSILDKKLRIFNTYNSLLLHVDGIEELPLILKNTLHSNWLYGIIVNSDISRDDLCEELLAHGIETRPFFYPLHCMPPYEHFKRSRSLKFSENISRNGLSLPTSVDLTNENLLTITNCLREKLNIKN
jgi:perosamine synthetase